MAYRSFWGREQWTHAITRACVDQGHQPVPCDAHQREIEEGVARDAVLLNSPEVVASTKAWMEKHLRLDPPAVVGPCQWPVASDDPDGPPTLPCRQDAWLTSQRSEATSAGKLNTRVRVLCVSHLVQDVLARGSAVVDIIESVSKDPPE